MTVKRIIAAVLYAALLVSSAWGAVEQSAPAQGAVAVTPPAVANSYVLGAGDVLDISVWKDDALTKTVVVLPDGRINFPLVGEIAAGGKTVAELRKELELKLVRFVPDLVLSVDVKQSNSMLVYVIGRVNAPGRFMLNSKINVLQALSMAGGLNPFAEKDAIKIYRYEGDKPVVYSFRYNDVAKKDRMDQNIWLKQGDVILVP